jgi:HAD superfamily hydrolase (TIGR01509 family)
MIKTKIQAILFDWHGVLDKTLLDGFFDFISLECSLSKDLLKVKLGNICRNYSLGNILSDDFWEIVRQETGASEFQLNKFKKYVNSIEINTELWKHLSILKKSYRLAILSDCPLEKVTLIRKNINLSLFDKVYFSAEENLDKKMTEFFELAIKSLDLKTTAILFVDDSQKNIDFASKLGVRGHLFTDFENFKNVIQSLDS